MPRYAEADANFMRATSHPLRGSIVYELFARGEGTATEVATAIDEPVNSVSFHLRQLERYGIVEEVPRPDGDRRQRWWRVAADGWTIDQERIKQQPGGKGAIVVRKRHALAWWRALMERYFLGEHPRDEVWVVNDIPVRLTDAEAEQMATEVREVLMRWRDVGRAAGDDDPGRRTYLGFGIVLPHQPDLGRVKRS